MATTRDKLKVLKALAVMAWSDGRMDDKEAKALRDLAGRMGLSGQARSAVEGYIVSRPALSDVQFEELTPKEREALLLTAIHFAYLDGQASEHERQVLQTLADRLGVSRQRLAEMEEEIRGRLVSAR